MAGHHAVKPSRREFCFSSAAALIGLSLKSDRQVAGSFVNDDAALGHLIRDRAPLSPARSSERVPVVIVGGGVAGLSAAWRLQKKGFDRFVLLEMNGQAGGNSRWGENAVVTPSSCRGGTRFSFANCSRNWAC